MVDGKIIVALCTSRIYEAVCNDFISHLSGEIARHNGKLFVYSTVTDLYFDDASDHGEAAVFDLIDYDITDVVIIYAEKLKNDAIVSGIINDSHDHGKPVVVIDGYHDDCVNINFDYEQGFEAIVRHIVEEHGISDVHFMGGIKDNDFSETRKRTFIKVLEDNKIPFSEDMVSYGDFWTLPARKATQRLINENRVPRCIICANDTMAIAVSAALKDNGFSLPDDVIVTGFDGIDEINYSVPRITSCECRNEDVAYKITELMPDMISGKITSGNYMISPSLVLSQSCGCSEGKMINFAWHFSRLNDRFNRYMGEELSLFNLAAKLRTAPTIEEASAVLANRSPSLIYNMSCILKKECIDETVNPLKKQSDDFGEELCLFWDSDKPEVEYPCSINSKEVIPFFSDKMQSPYPLLFSALHIMDVPMGYVCFHFYDYALDNYVKIPQIVSTLNYAFSGLRNMRHQQYLNRRIEENYRTDALTGLYNRRGFSMFYNRLISSLKEDESITFILADLDGLKHINDYFGHDEGDNAISTVASALKKVLPQDSINCRFGGDEMACVTKLVLDEAKIKNQLEEFFEDYNHNSGKPYQVSASIGIYRSEPGESLDFEYLLKKADILMYSDKEKKRALRGK